MTTTMPSASLQAVGLGTGRPVDEVVGLGEGKAVGFDVGYNVGNGVGQGNDLVGGGG